MPPWRASSGLLLAQDLDSGSALRLRCVSGGWLTALILVPPRPRLGLRPAHVLDGPEVDPLLTRHRGAWCRLVTVHADPAAVNLQELPWVAGALGIPVRLVAVQRLCREGVIGGHRCRVVV